MELLIRLVADGVLLFLVLVAGPVVYLSIRHRFWSSVPVLIMAGLTSLLAGKVLSLLYQPTIARPFMELGAEPGAAYIDNPGFPSDHALLATVIIVAIYMLTQRQYLTAGLVLLGLAMSVGRVIALVHTPLDVLGGIAAGLVGIIWYKKLTKQSKKSTI